MEFYNQKTVKRGRSVKWCSCCDCEIDKALHYVIPNIQMDASFVLCVDCMSKAEEMYKGKEWDRVETFIRKVGNNE